VLLQRDRHAPLDRGRSNILVYMASRASGLPYPRAYHMAPRPVLSLHLPVHESADAHVFRVRVPVPFLLFFAICRRMFTMF